MVGAHLMYIHCTKLSTNQRKNLKFKILINVPSTEIRPPTVPIHADIILSNLFIRLRRQVVDGRQQLEGMHYGKYIVSVEKESRMVPKESFVSYLLPCSQPHIYEEISLKNMYSLYAYTRLHNTQIDRYYLYPVYLAPLERVKLKDSQIVNQRWPLFHTIL